MMMANNDVQSVIWNEQPVIARATLELSSHLSYLASYNGDRPQPVLYYEPPQT